jgi:hypothetical protein
VHTQFLPLTVPTIKRYANRHGMDSQVAELLDFGLPPSWLKVTLLRDLLDQGYDGVLWVDADALFVRTDEDIRTLATAPWNWVHNEYYQPGQPCVPCAGVLAVTQGAQPILDHVWKLQEVYRDHPWWEQRAALEVFGWDEPSGTLRNPDGQAALPARWNSTPASPGDDLPVIYHASGIFPVESRVQYLRQYAA